MACRQTFSITNKRQGFAAFGEASSSSLNSELPLNSLKWISGLGSLEGRHLLSRRGGSLQAVDTVHF